MIEEEIKTDFCVGAHAVLILAVSWHVSYNLMKSRTSDSSPHSFRGCSPANVCLSGRTAEFS